jgi:hypothetical protein
LSPAGLRRTLYAALAVLFVLHNDLWLWHDSGSFLGLPVGLSYHVGFCLAVSAVMAVLVSFAWPSDLGGEDSPTDP